MIYPRDLHFLTFCNVKIAITWVVGFYRFDLSQKSVIIHLFYAIKHDFLRSKDIYLWS